MKNIKNILLAFAVIAMVIPVFNGCKKGENDPFLSLKSRDGRLTGEWKLTKLERTKTTDTKANTVNLATGATYQNTLQTETWTYDGSSYTTSDKNDYSGTAVVSGSTTSDNTTKNYDYSVELTLDKHGLAKATETKTQKSTTLATTPTNTWTGCTPGQNCDGTYTITTPTTITTTYEGTWNWANNKKNKEAVTIDMPGFAVNGTYFIDRLKSKELVLIDNSVDNTSNSGNNNGSTSITDKGTWTFEAK